VERMNVKQGMAPTFSDPKDMAVQSAGHLMPINSDKQGSARPSIFPRNYYFISQKGFNGLELRWRLAE
jgi:hypothetical protein